MIVFKKNPDGTFDLSRRGRSLEVDIPNDPALLADALRRRRIPLSEKVYIEDESGHRILMPRR